MSDCEGMSENWVLEFKERIVGRVWTRGVQNRRGPGPIT